MIWLGPLRIERFDGGVDLDLFTSRKIWALTIAWASYTVDR